MIGGSLWYEYVAVIFRSLTSVNRATEAAALASSVLDANKASNEGYAIVGSEYARWLINNRKKVRAFQYFEWIAKEQPTHRQAASAHYWLALRCQQAGNLIEAQSRAKAVRICFAGRPALESEWMIDAKALWISINLDDNRINLLSSFGYTQSYLKFVLGSISIDIEKIK